MESTWCIEYLRVVSQTGFVVDFFLLGKLTKERLKISFSSPCFPLVFVTHSSGCSDRTTPSPLTLLDLLEPPGWSDRPRYGGWNQAWVYAHRQHGRHARQHRHVQGACKQYTSHAFFCVRCTGVRERSKLSIGSVFALQLYRPGTVAYVSKSGGMSNELNNIIARNSDGVYEGVAIGGDRYPGTRFIDHLLRYQDNPAVSVRLRDQNQTNQTLEISADDNQSCVVVTRP